MKSRKKKATKSARSTPKKTCRLDLRIAPDDRSRIKALARIYANGSVSKWVVYAALAAERRMLP